MSLIEKTVVGNVEWFAFQPGELNRFHVNVSGHAGTVVFLNETDSELTWDGDKIDIDWLVTKLLTEPCEATLHPRIDRYGAATKAEFRPISK